MTWPTGHALDPPHLPCIKRSSEVSWHGFCPDLLLNLWGILQMSSRQTPQGACPKVRILSSCGWAGGKVAPNTARCAKGLTTSYHGISVLCVLVSHGCIHMLIISVYVDDGRYLDLSLHWHVYRIHIYIGTCKAFPYYSSPGKIEKWCIVNVSNVSLFSSDFYRSIFLVVTIHMDSP
jgi:hypothetical protein